MVRIIVIDTGRLRGVFLRGRRSSSARTQAGRGKTNPSGTEEIFMTFHPLILDEVEEASDVGTIIAFKEEGAIPTSGHVCMQQTGSITIDTMRGVYSRDQQIFRCKKIMLRCEVRSSSQDASFVDPSKSLT